MFIAQHRKINSISQNTEAYTKPQSSHILHRFQLICLKQGNVPLEEFITKERLHFEESQYAEEAKDEMLRDTLVFDLESDQVPRNAIKLGNVSTISVI